MCNTGASGGDTWPRATAPTAVDYLLADIAAVSAGTPSSHLPTHTARGLFQTIPGTWKGAPTMDASQKHHSDILDTLSDYLTRPEVTSLLLDRDSGTDTWAITATVDVDPEHEARKLEADMAEAVQMTTGGTIHDQDPNTPPPVTVPKSVKHDPRDILPIVDSLAPLPDPHSSAPEMVLEVIDRDGDTWRRCWDGTWVLISGTNETAYPNLSLPRSWSSLVADYGPIQHTVTSCQHCIDSAKGARHGA